MSQMNENDGINRSNLDIGIIPEITRSAGLNNISFDYKISYDLEKWFLPYRKNCLPGMQNWVVNNIKERLAADENPLLLALKLYANCPDCSMKVRNTSAALSVMKAVANLKKTCPQIAEQCTDNMRMVAFNFMKMQGMPALYEEVVFAYDLVDHKHLFKDKLLDMLKKNHYKEVAQMIIMLKLTDEFKVFDVVLPLIFQDKLFLAEEYLDASPNLQLETVTLLDNLLGGGSIQRSLDEYARTYNYTEVKFERLEYKPLKKLISRLVTKYNISLKETPNLQKSKAIGFIKHLTYKRYSEKMIEQASWRELIMENVGLDDFAVQHELINAICFYNECEEAEFWAQFYKYPKERLHHRLQECINRKYSTKFTSAPSENSKKLSKAPETYDIVSKNCSIVFVDNPTAFDAMIICLKSQEVIGFDSEWKPMMYEDSRLSLIQIATRETIYLIDVLVNFGKDLWTSFSHIFNSDCILKLGFSLQNDLNICTKTIPELTITTLTPYFLDIEKLWKEVRDLNLFQFPYKTSSSGETLSILVEQCFGKPLNKQNQFSNWGKRPLRDDQIKYAATDAYCLLDIYDKIVQEINRSGVPPPHIIESVIYGSKAKSKKKKKPTQRKKHQEPSIAIDRY